MVSRILTESCFWMLLGENHWHDIESLLAYFLTIAGVCFCSYTSQMLLRRKKPVLLLGTAMKHYLFPCGWRNLIGWSFERWWVWQPRGTMSRLSSSLCPLLSDEAVQQLEVAGIKTGQSSDSTTTKHLIM